MMWKILTAGLVLSVARVGHACADPSGALVAQADPRTDAPPLVAQQGPASIDGCWNLILRTPFPLPDQEGRFSFTTDGSVLRGTVTLHGDVFQVRDGTVDGGRITFRIEHDDFRARFEGERHGAELRGTLSFSDRRWSWTATRCRSRN